MKVYNMKSPKTGKPVANQFVINDDIDTRVFQSYDSIIVKIVQGKYNRIVYLDQNYWNYSKTTSKYRNQFLGETTKETMLKIKSGEYILTDLN